MKPSLVFSAICWRISASLLSSLGDAAWRCLLPYRPLRFDVDMLPDILKVPAPHTVLPVGATFSPLAAIPAAVANALPLQCAECRRCERVWVCAGAVVYCAIVTNSPAAIVNAPAVIGFAHCTHFYPLTRICAWVVSQFSCWLRQLASVVAVPPQPPLATECSRSLPVRVLSMSVSRLSRPSAAGEHHSRLSSLPLSLLRLLVGILHCHCVVDRFRLRSNATSTDACVSFSL